MNPGSVETAIRDSLQYLDPEHMEIFNESFMHNVPEGSESHFKVVIVSSQFQDKMLVARHRMVNELLKQQIEGPVHALSLHTMTPDEWFEKAGQSAESPECLGGNKL